MSSEEDPPDDASLSTPTPYEDPDEPGAAPPPSEDDELERASAAARAALARARAAAAARGLRPGIPGPRPRRRRLAGEAKVSGTHADERDPQLFGSGIERLVSERGWAVDVAVGAVMGRWNGVVGDTVAQHCAPESFQDGVLVVRADSTAWATQVRLLVPTVLRRLSEELGPDVVLQLQVKGPNVPNWRRGARTVRGRGPRDTYG